jgi:hypothetical protein
MYIVLEHFNCLSRTISWRPGSDTITSDRLVQKLSVEIDKHAIFVA